ncbi:MAG: GWxTD domain-containing protein [Acidobacteriota bacterium]
MKKALVISALFLAGAAFFGCGGGPRVVLDPESAAFYETARLIMSAEEKDIFNHLPDAASRREFIEDFWRKRDPLPETEENEFQKEFFGRIEYANKRFKEGGPGWNTDRGRIYIFMGPPDKHEEFFTHGDSEVRGPILWWIYYNYELGIEFVDERNNGTFKMRNYQGDFFSALDNIKMGGVPTLKGEKRKFVNFKLAYVASRKTIEIRIPAEAFNFRDEQGQLRADLDLEFSVYAKGMAKIEEFHERWSFAQPYDTAAEMKEVFISLSHELAPGEYFLDATIIGPDGTLGKTRKIFAVKVEN